MTGTQRDLATRVVELVRASAPSADAEVLVDTFALALTRFANSAIHQNVAEVTTTIRLTVHADGRTAGGSTTRTDPDAIADLVARTLAAARLCPLDAGWPGLSTPTPLLATGTVDDALRDASPADRAGRVRAFVDAAGGLTTAGYCRTKFVTTAFANTAGQVIAGEMTEIAMDGIARTATSDGAARLAGAHLADVDGAILGARAAAKARAAVDPVEMPPGQYEVVLEPTAVNDLLQAFGSFGFDGKAVNERRSFLQVGTAQFDPSITLVDDAVSPGVVGLTFDSEGTPKRRVELVTGGETRGPVHNRRTAALANTESTGAAPPSGEGGSAFTANLTLCPAPAGSTGPAGSAGTGVTEVPGPAADSAVAALIGNVTRGVLVTDHWYTRVLDPRTLVMTGLTRNGIWLIENGEVTTPLRNFRFTQSYPQALAPGRVFGVGSVAVTLPSAWSGISLRAPALHLASWNFTGGASG